MNSTEILVTGGTGVLGSKVVERLRSAGIEPRVLSHSNRPGTIQGDLLTGEGLEAVSGVDTIVHCASSPFRKTHQTDVVGTRRLLEAASRAGVSHLVYISIVGIERASSYPYYRIKLETERLIGQPIDSGEVADRMVELALSEPAGRVPDIGGREVRTVDDMVRSYLKLTGSRKRVVPFPLPGKTARAIRSGALTCPANRYGRITWEQFLREELDRRQETS
jgi:uncharacterized protein YbjT (DUF2867 family)